MAANPITFVTPEQYLEWELEAEEKSEYFNGEIFAIARPSPRHALIVMNVAGGFWQQFKGKPCRVYPGEVRLRVTPTGPYTYPDAMVVCGDVQFTADQKGTVLNPVVIVEVLSKSTQDFDLS